ncbi:MAG TPA: Asp-tRNA(Asn)/Glu-tRNA(Gln) amidotransferase subunit GatA [Vicinamibacterales bacterium]|nr:Asp-tRNA(Asn)/Glu-tRNA(Gln) amidotransferase subunit GatA [Vicinamibacterales bacterium]
MTADRPASGSRAPAGSACEIRAAIASGRTTATEVCRATLEAIDRLDPSLHAFLLVDREGALARAAELDRQPPPDAPLLGVPIALKDNICTRGLPTTAGSRLLEQYRPPYDATVVSRLHAAGAIVIGKTNLDEFAMGSSTEHSAFGPTFNPWAHDRVPGGSSGGSAAAVAAGLVPIALGSDTGGSVRQPAALCGVLGVKPTYGRVSRYGLIAFASSLDQIAPFARTTEDAALVLRAITGEDPCDATTAPAAPIDVRPNDAGLQGLRVGVPHRLLDGIEEDVRTRFEAALAELSAAGATLADVELKHAPLAVPVYYLVANAEASSNLARYDGVRYGFRADASSIGEMYYKTRAAFGAEVKRRIMIGTYVLSAGYWNAFYLKAQAVRALIRQDYAAAFASVDVIATPTSPTTAFRIGERVEDPLQMYLSDVFTVPANLAGLPAATLPCGEARSGLPVGVQFTARAFEEATLLRIAREIEQRTDWFTHRPPLSVESRK